MKSQNKWICAAIPGLLLHCSIGTVYCWSYVSGAISAAIGYEVKTVNWAFSIAILFLGMSAAFLGNFVEKDIHKASLIATICFSIGMAGTGFFVWYGSNQFAATGTPSALALVGIYLFYGVIMGIGLGTGYLSPVKTLMLWFEDRKGLATGLALVTNGIVNGAANTGLAIIVVALIFVVNAGYGGGFSNVPTLLSDHYGMGSISAIHGITLSAWGFAGIAGPQLAAFIVKNFGGETVDFEYHGHTVTANPLGYQRILVATLILYIVSLVICMVLVKPTDKALEAKAKKQAK